MNVKIRKATVDAYKKILDTKDAERLGLFEGLWELRDEQLCSAPGAQDATSSYEIPSLSLLEGWYWEEKAVFAESPFLIDKDSFVAALEACTNYLTTNAGLAEELAEALDSFSWKELVEQNDLVLAGTNPMAYIEDCCAWIDTACNSSVDTKVDATADVEADTKAEEANAEAVAFIDIEVAAFILASSLRAMLQHAAASVMNTLAPYLKEANNLHIKPKQCPLCGSAPQASSVGETPSGLSNGRLLYCGICGIEWEFERIRCAHCGTQSQSHLHYFHIDGDEAHRLYSCQECGEYMRTVFQEHLSTPLSLEVEDIIMTRLDAAAHDDRFNEQAESQRTE